jgi:hypothetical protein
MIYGRSSLENAIYIGRFVCEILAKYFLEDFKRY